MKEVVKTNAPLPSPQSSGDFKELTDRSIGLATAKKYGVKAKEQGGKIIQHSYPYYVANEIAGNAILSLLYFTTNSAAKC